LYEKRIEIRWSDMDAYGHVNNATYLTYLEEARDEWMQSIFEVSEQAGLVLARVAIDFRKELTQDDGMVVARCTPTRLGRSSIHTHEEVLLEDGTVSAEAEAVIVATDARTRRPRPLSTAERAAVDGLIRSAPSGE
jgi:acyl-CoA thioester hydrolase